MKRSLFLALAVLAAFALAGDARAQYSVISTPFHNVGDSFFERNGVGFGFNIPGGNPGSGNSAVVGLGPNGQFIPGGGLQFRQNGAGNALPQFGGHVPGQDATLGFGILNGNGGGAFFNFSAGQGNNRSNVSQTPMVTVPNGGQGTFIDTFQRPFVTGVIPVVGGGGAPLILNNFGSGGFGGGFGGAAPSVSPLAERISRMYDQQAGPSVGRSREELMASAEEPAPRGYSAPVSSAATGDVGVAEIRAQQAAEDAAAQAEILALIERARGLEEQGKANIAKIWYQRAYREASGELKERIAEKLRALGN